MYPNAQPDALPVEEFPEAPFLLQEWKSGYLDAILGRATLPRRHDLDSVVSRMYHLHVSKVRWYSTNVPLEFSGDRLRTFELASGSQWDASPALQPRAGATASQDPGLGGTNPYHQHHYMIAEISLPIQDSIVPHAPAASSVSAHFPSPSSPVKQRKTLGYLRIEGTCGSDCIMVPSSGSSVSASMDLIQIFPDPLTVPSANTSSTRIQQPTPRPPTTRQGDVQHARSLDSELLRTRILDAALRSEGSSVSTLGIPNSELQGPASRDGLLPLPLPPRTGPGLLSDLLIPASEEPSTIDDATTPSHSGDVDATPVTRQFPRSWIEQTPTRSRPHGSSRQYGSPLSPGEDGTADINASSLQGHPSGAIATPSAAQEPGSHSSRPIWTDHFDQPYLDKASSPSPLFISPFASRSNSVTRSQTSTDTTRSQVDTRPNSRSNSSSNSPPASNATSFTTSSSFSLSSAGLVFSNNPLDRPDSSGLAGQSARFVVTYLEEVQTIEEAQANGDDECVLELSFPVHPLPNPGGPDSPQSFFTFRDLTILADLVERSLKEGQRYNAEQEARSSSSTSDSASESAYSDVSEESTGPSEMSIDGPECSTCCCEFFNRLVNVVPLVSGLRATGGSKRDMFMTGGEHADISKHYDTFSHHGRSLRTPFENERGSGERPDEDTSSAFVARLKGQLERRKARFDSELLSAARSVEHRTEARLIAQVEVSSTSSNSPFTVLPIVPASFVPALALEEARLVTERFLTAVREVEEPRASTPSLDEGL
ncbi:hypothetical protein MD484_g8528, partial [Candolleomyces efflorescens]